MTVGPTDVTLINTSTPSAGRGEIRVKCSTAYPPGAGWKIKPSQTFRNFGDIVERSVGDDEIGFFGSPKPDPIIVKIRDGQRTVLTVSYIA